MTDQRTTKPTLRCADLIVKALAFAGVSRIFALSGNQIMPLFDACCDTGIEIVHTRHEAACVYMAEAHAQLTGELGVALVTAGVGLGNAVGPLYCALTSESPVLLLSGDSPHQQDTQGAFQEMDQLALTRSVTRFRARPTTRSQLQKDLVLACETAVGSHAGPVHIALPADLLLETVDDAAVPALRIRRNTAIADRAVSESMLQALVDAARPLILLGPSLNPTRAPGLARSLLQATGAPAVAIESPRGVKDPQFCNLGAAIEAADTILLLGKAIDFSTGFARHINAGCTVLVVDDDTAVLTQSRRNLPGDTLQCFQADPQSTTAVLCEAKTGRAAPRTAWHDSLATLLAQPDFNPIPESPSDELHPATLCQAVQTAIDLSDDPILIVDGGEFGQWAQAVCHAPRRVINGPAGSIGGAIPAAIAASLAYPNADIFVLMGDGSAGFHVAELDTAVRSGARFTLVIGNDRRWNAEHQIQLRDFGEERLIGCELGAANYAGIARSVGASGHLVRNSQDLATSLATGGQGVVCIDARIRSMPAPSPT